MMSGLLVPLPSAAGRSPELFCKTTGDFMIAVLLLLLFVTGTLLNLTLVFGILKEKLYLTASNLYIMNLAIADTVIAVGIAFFPFLNYALMSWPFGATTCRMVELIRDTATPVSVMTLCAMSYDRYQAISSTAIRNPNARKVSAFYMTSFFKSRAGVTIMLTWFLAVVSVVPLIYLSHLVGLTVDKKRDHIVCTLDRYEYVEPKLLVVIRCAVTYIIPLAIIAYNYGAIVYKMFSLSHSLKSCAGSPAMDRSRKKAKTRAKQILVLVLIFLFCSFPRHAFLWVLYFFSDGVKVNVNFWNTWRTIGFYLFYLYPVLNPVSLYVTSEQYKRLFDKYLLRCRVAPLGQAITEEEEEMSDHSKFSHPTTESHFMTHSHSRA